MRRRSAVLVSALAIFAAFVSAPYEHVHTSTDVRHAHVTPHDTGHDHGAPDPAGQTPHGDEDAVAANAFLSDGQGTAVSPVAVIASPVAVREIEHTLYRAPGGETRAHGPPMRPRSPRAPPFLPAF